MKTDRLIDMLATDGSVTDRSAPSRRFGIAVLAGIAAAVVAMAVGLGVRPDLGTVVHSVMFWLRMGFAVAMLAAALLAATRLARPGVAAGPGVASIAIPVVLAWCLAVIVLVHAPESARLALLLGRTWRVCPPLIAALSVPAFAAMFWAMRGMAPVRLRLAGAMAGGQAYWNIHSSSFPGGEIRGFLVAVPEPGTMTLAGIGLMGLAAGGACRRRWMKG